jgi:AFG3 family protein
MNPDNEPRPDRIIPLALALLGGFVYFNQK